MNLSASSSKAIMPSKQPRQGRLIRSGHSCCAAPRGLRPPGSAPPPFPALQSPAFAWPGKKSFARASLALLAFALV